MCALSPARSSERSTRWHISLERGLHLACYVLYGALFLSYMARFLCFMLHAHVVQVYSMYLSNERAKALLDQAAAQTSAGMNRQNGHILVLICSGVLLLASAIECGRTKAGEQICEPRTAWAVSCAAVLPSTVPPVYELTSVPRSLGACK